MSGIALLRPSVHTAYDFNTAVDMNGDTTMTLDPHLIAVEYRDPSSSERALADDDAYCVGGALCLAAGWTWRFPTRPLLLQSLRDDYHVPDSPYLSQICEAVLQLNDLQLFDDAWDVAFRVIQEPVGSHRWILVEAMDALVEGLGHIPWERLEALRKVALGVENE